MTKINPLVILAIVAYAAAVDWDTVTDFDRYVRRPDPSYSWEELTGNRYDLENCTIYTINMTSQTWKDDSFSTISLWFHHMTITIPKNFTNKEHGMLFISGGRQTSRLPTPENDPIVAISCDFAQKLGVAMAYIKQIPNQPMYFKDDPTQRRRSEDSIIAYTWRKFIDDNSDPEILLRYPMTKAIIRAMDTVNVFVKSKVPDSDVNKFVVSGASKRGWTAWTAAAMDWQRRVIGVVPIVMDLLIMHPNLMRMYMAYGGWSFALGSYYRENITQYAHLPEKIQPLADQVDPYSYRERLTMPKLIMSASGDEFFLPDNSHIYIYDIPPPTFMLLLENTNHGLTLSEERAYLAVEGFYQTILSGRQWPVLQWSRVTTNTSGVIQVRCSERPKRVVGLFTDTENRNRRDFRYITADDFQPILWLEEDVTEVEPLVYRYEVTGNPDTFTGMLINVVFDGPNDTELDFSSEINIIPDLYPYDMCTSAAQCYGTLV